MARLDRCGAGEQFEGRICKDVWEMFMTDEKIPPNLPLANMYNAILSHNLHNQTPYSIHHAQKRLISANFRPVPSCICTTKVAKLKNVWADFCLRMYIIALVTPNTLLFWLHPISNKIPSPKGPSRTMARSFPFV